MAEGKRAMSTNLKMMPQQHIGSGICAVYLAIQNGAEQRSRLQSCFLDLVDIESRGDLVGDEYLELRQRTNMGPGAWCNQRLMRRRWSCSGTGRRRVLE
ncbi:hypothetical protein TRIUR3_27767 [Triticum urartu]|uniref:Uncharacterized protein n=1 Tax=Triticum urartu TaxID=4572 RepID=M7ZEC5_TRIUA|nr:hypothetical protein TRIUR3_27767 [Triticum urartu]